MLPSVAVTVESWINARAALCTTLVDSVPLTASDSPSPNALPPEDSTELSAIARMVAFSIALRPISPIAAVTVASRTYASTAPRTSLTTTSPPTARESEPVRLKPWGTRLVSGAGCQ